MQQSAVFHADAKHASPRAKMDNRLSLREVIVVCGRYLFYDYQELRERLARLNVRSDFLDRFPPTWNAAPTQNLPVLFDDGSGVAIQGMRWGLVPKWTKPGQLPKVTPINARSETLAEKSMFRSLVKNRRCVVPTNGFYEWKRVGTAKQPYLIEPTDGSLMLLAGLYDEAVDARGSQLQSFTIVTTRANEKMARVHDRMPTILTLTASDVWLDHDLTDIGPLEHLLQPVADDAIAIRPVSRKVNTRQNDGPDLTEPIPEIEDA